MQIFLRDINGKSILFELSPIQSILDFKQQIEEKTKYPTNIQSLIYHGHVLKDDNYIQDYNIKENENIEVRFRLSGGGNWFSAQVNTIKQTNVNQFYQRSEQICSASCENVQSGNTIFLDGTTSGDIIFKQRCEADATCMMSNSVDVVMDLLQEFQQGNQTEAGLFPNFGSVNLNVSEQELRNQVEQIMNTVCNTDVTNIQNNNMVYARNSSTGDIIFEQDGNAQANCVMTNVASADLNLRQIGDQQNAIRGIGIGSIIGLVVLAIILMVVFSIIGRAKRASGGGGRQASK